MLITSANDWFYQPKSHGSKGEKRMNRKNRGLMLAVLLGILLFALTCGAALAEPPTFYVKMENTTNYAIKLKWHFSTRAGENASSDSDNHHPPPFNSEISGKAGIRPDEL